MTRLPAVFASLESRNYRRFWIGRAISITGSRMYWIAFPWLALKSTGSIVDTGWMLALHNLPTLVLSAPAGVLISRVGARRVAIVMQAVMGLHGALLTALTLTGTPPSWALFMFSLFLGVCFSFEVTATRLLVQEIVGDARLNNAHALDHVMTRGADIVGAATAGVLIAAAGEGWCFAINAVSFLAALLTVLSLDRDELAPAPILSRGRRQLRDGLHSAIHDRTIAALLVMAAIMWTLGLQSQVVLPALTEYALDSDVRALGLMRATLSLGAMIGGLGIARVKALGLRGLTVVTALGSPPQLVIALWPTLTTALVALAFLGALTAIYEVSGANAIQVATPPTLRGRVTAFHAGTEGLAAIGAPIVGWAIAASHAGAGPAVCAGGYLAAAAVGALALSAIRPDTAHPARSTSRSSADPEGKP